MHVVATRACLVQHIKWACAQHTLKNSDVLFISTQCETNTKMCIQATVTTKDDLVPQLLRRFPDSNCLYKQQKILVKLRLGKLEARMCVGATAQNKAA